MYFPIHWSKLVIAALNRIVNHYIEIFNGGDSTNWGAFLGHILSITGLLSITQFHPRPWIAGGKMPWNFAFGAFAHWAKIPFDSKKKVPGKMWWHVVTCGDIHVTYIYIIYPLWFGTFCHFPTWEGRFSGRIQIHGSRRSAHRPPTLGVVQMFR